jgi:hypothetical protein
VKENLTNIRALQNACISLESRDRRSLLDTREALNVEPTGLPKPSFRGKHVRGGYHIRGQSRGQFRGNFRGRSRGHHPGHTQNRVVNTICRLCDKPGHLVACCPSLREAKNKWKNPQANFVNANGTDIIIDSGASQHMFNSRELFDDDIQHENTRVICADATDVEATHVGTVNLQIQDDQDPKSLTL